MIESMKLAHFSDLHFHHFQISPRQFFSKTWVGNFNGLFNRRRGFSHGMLFTLPDKLKELGVEGVVISGDFTTTSSIAEFKMAARFLSKLRDEGFSLYIVPGNHDIYTKRSERESRFYKEFSPYVSFSGVPSFDLETDHVTAYQLTSSWYLATFDAAKPSSLLHSTGNFHETVEKNLYSLLSSIPKSSHIILLGHFPYHIARAPSHRMKGRKVLSSLLNDFPNVQIYLHGHTHKQQMVNINDRWLLNSGSISEVGKSFFYLIDLEIESFRVDTFHYLGNAFQRIDDQKITANLV